MSNETDQISQGQLVEMRDQEVWNSITCFIFLFFLNQDPRIIQSFINAIIAIKWRKLELHLIYNEEDYIP